MNLVNLGCGSTYREGWINLDLEPPAPEVRKWDLRRGIPLAPGSVDAVYMSHVLEHLSRSDAKAVLLDALRVLRSGGVIRVVVPDLELQCREYLAALEAVVHAEPGAEARDEWMRLELLDQMVRSRVGGDLLEHILAAPPAQRDFIRRRIGAEADVYWEKPEAAPGVRLPRSGLLHRLPNWIRRKLAAAAVRVIAGPAAAAAFHEGLFRNSGEVHRWMYDRVSLDRLLRDTGFASYRVVDAWTSGIPSFARYELDAAGRQVRKPDSIFVEAVKP